MSAQVTRRRGEYAKSAARREQILDAAAEVFSRSGFTAASLADIAEAANMSIAGLNHHFATKTQLLEAVFDRSREVAVSLFTSSDPLDNLRASLDLAQSNEGDPVTIRLFAVMSAEATSPEHPAHHRLLQHYDATLNAVLGSFVELERSGRLRPDVRPDDAARAYVALSDGLQIQAMYQPDAFSQPDVIRRLLSSFLTEPL
ncbi:TetR/AcrR family transcriptional regulator [Microbacterium sp. 1P10UB]|uniref:TetR/AcrR family transcriptional regulator n=1 Tax=unclassified Microbacterium TaxID=2609290 RepID=UPI0039A2ABF3